MFNVFWNVPEAHVGSFDLQRIKLLHVMFMTEWRCFSSLKKITFLSKHLINWLRNQ